MPAKSWQAPWPPTPTPATTSSPCRTRWLAGSNPCSTEGVQRSAVAGPSQQLVGDQPVTVRVLSHHRVLATGKEAIQIPGLPNRAGPLQLLSLCGIGQPWTDPKGATTIERSNRERMRGRHERVPGNRCDRVEFFLLGGGGGRGHHHSGGIGA